MTTAENERQDLTRYAISDSAIQKMGAQYMSLTVNGVEDKEGLATVHAARMDMRSHRVQVEKTRKALNEEALARTRAVNGEAKRITELMAPIEAHLTVEEARVTTAIKAEKERKAAELLATRMEQLKSVESPRHFRDVELMTDEQFSVAYWADHADFAARKITEAAEAKRKAEEAGRLAKEKAELEEQRAEQEAESKRITAARLELEAEQAEARKVEDARLQAERDRIERERAELAKQKSAAKVAEARVAAERERAERELAKVKAAEEAEAHRLRMAPEVEQVRSLATLMRQIEAPHVSCKNEIRKVLVNCASRIDQIANDLETQTPNPRN